MDNINTSSNTIRLSRSFFYFSALISLIFTFTNFIPLSLFFSFLVIFLPLTLYSHKSFSLILIATLCLYLYFFIWTFIYDPLALVAYKFYRRDGNVFFTLLPIIIFGLFSLKMDIEAMMKKFLLTVTLINTVTFFIHKVHPTFAGEVSGDRNYYFFYFLSHNGAGGFLANLLAISLAFWLKKRSFVYLFCTIINTLTLLSTHSRGSILAFIGALVVYLAFKERFSKLFVWFSIIVSVIVLSIGYYYWDLLGKPAQFIGEKQLSEESSIEVDFERSWTFIDRGLFLWPRAVDLFLKSPIFGTGFGSFNDGPYELKGLEHLVMMNFPEEFIYSDAHAHHSYIHILAETGIIGLFLTMLMLIYMRRLFLSLESKVLRDAFMMMFWISVWSSMTEHRLFTPSQMLPFTILTGLLIGSLRAEQSWMDAKILRPYKYKLHFSLPKIVFRVNLPLFKIRKRL